MRTTIRIDDDLLRQLKERAARTGRSVGSLIEDAVRVALATSTEREAVAPSLPTFGGSGVLPGVDLSSAAALRDVMEEDVALDALR